ncbi:MAG: hypothetical protein Q8900_07740 [Bacillota bacterium]|nr:hypothetical protein [Bacillota bacterium]
MGGVVLFINENLYLFNNFDSAIKKAVELSGNTKITLLYELFLNTKTREWYGKTHLGE